MEVTLIGMGPGDPSALTGGALTALERADVLIGSRRLVEGCTLAPEAQRFCSTKSAEIVEILAEGRWERPCVLYSGDTGFHSGTRTLLPQLAERGISWRVLPGVSSMQYFAARLDRPWQEWRVVSAHGLACDPVGEVLAARGRPVFFLTGGAGGAAARTSCLVMGTSPRRKAPSSIPWERTGQTGAAPSTSRTDNVENSCSASSQTWASTIRSSG